MEQNYIYKQFLNNLIKKAISIISEPFDIIGIECIVTKDLCFFEWFYKIGKSTYDSDDLKQSYVLCSEFRNDGCISLQMMQEELRKIDARVPNAIRILYDKHNNAWKMKLGDFNISGDVAISRFQEWKRSFDETI